MVGYRNFQILCFSVNFNISMVGNFQILCFDTNFNISMVDTETFGVNF